MNRKEFLTGAYALALGGILPVGARAAQSLPKLDLTADDRKRLNGVLDIHVHAAPDTKARLLTEIEVVEQAKAAGFRGIMFKSNDFSCHDRAFLIDQMIDGIGVWGSVCMNDVVGNRVNPIVARKAVGTTGKLCRCIWMPTQNAEYQIKTYKQKGAVSIPVLDNGKVLPEVVEVMEICAEHDIIFASGHSGPEETLVLAQKAREVGVKKFVVTHANSGIWTMTHDQIRKAIDLGAFVEYSYITNLWGPGTGLPDFKRQSDAEFCAFAAIDPSRSFVTTDLGQVGMPSPVTGMLTCIKALEKAGLSSAQIDMLTKTNPAHLVGL